MDPLIPVQLTGKQWAEVLFRLSYAAEQQWSEEAAGSIHFLSTAIADQINKHFTTVSNREDHGA